MEAPQGRVDGGAGGKEARALGRCKREGGRGKHFAVISNGCAFSYFCVGNIYKNAQHIHKKVFKNKEYQKSEIISEIPVGDQNKQSQ